MKQSSLEKMLQVSDNLEVQLSCLETTISQIPVQISKASADFAKFSDVQNKIILDAAEALENNSFWITQKQELDEKIQSMKADIKCVVAAKQVHAKNEEQHLKLRLEEEEAKLAFYQACIKDCQSEMGFNRHSSNAISTMVCAGDFNNGATSNSGSTAAAIRGTPSTTAKNRPSDNFPNCAATNGNLTRSVSALVPCNVTRATPSDAQRNISEEYFSQENIYPVAEKERVEGAGVDAEGENNFELLITHTTMTTLTTTRAAQVKKHWHCSIAVASCHIMQLNHHLL